MAYVKNTWVDREGQTRYHETIDDDGALIFTPDYEKVTELGTPVNADNMNHIEEGIADHENRISVLENSEGEDYVKKSGDTMTGGLVIRKSGAGQLQLINTSMDKATPPASTQYNQLKFVDNNNQDYGFLQCRQLSNNSYLIELGVKHQATSGYTTFALGCDKDGNGYVVGSGVVNQYMAQMSMPSTKSVDLTLNSSGSTFTAPDNGWFYLQTHSSKASYAFINNTSAGNMSAECAYSTDPKVIMPAQKGQVVKVEYDGTPKMLKFIYAEGSK